MRKDYEKLFSNIYPPNPPIELFDKIMGRINAERRLRTLRRRVLLFSIGLTLSMLALIPSVKLVYSNSIQSGFIQLSSLLFSDSSVVAFYWSNFLMSLLETLPAASLAMVLAAMFVFFGSLKFLLKDIKNITYLNKNLI